MAVTEPESVLGGWVGGQEPRWPWVEAIGTQPFSPFPLPQPLLANEKIKISLKVAKGWFEDAGSDGGRAVIGAAGEDSARALVVKTWLV